MVTPSARTQKLVRYAPVVVATTLLAAVTTETIRTHTGGAPAVPLDDAYIHFQYARSFANLHPLVYSPGAAPAAGATSLLWPLLLAPFYLLGLHGASIIYAAWLLGWVSLGLLSWDTWQLARGLASRASAFAAGAMVLAFGGYAWCAASGMEVVPFAWLLVRTARRSAEWLEAGASRDAPAPSSALRAELIVLAIATPLMRPEGAIATLLAAVALARFPRSGSRAWALLPLVGPLLVPALDLMLAGQATSTTAMVKWLPLSPYHHGAELWRAIGRNVELFFTTLLDGEAWSASVLPTGGRIVGWLVLPAIAYAGVERRRGWRAACVLAVAAGIFIPATYDSFLWNRLRYLWPFAAGWFVGLATLADIAGDVLAKLRLPDARAVLAGAFVGALAGHLHFAIEDVAVSADAISKQQGQLGHWAHDALPADARIGVNDTGAIAYFSDRRVFDICGLTTAGESRYWVAGVGSRFEHYERLGRSRLPTHFIVYPNWFAIPALLGHQLTERTVMNATILGGTTMVAAVADYSALGTGDAPVVAAPAGKRVDVLDVADLESERDRRVRAVLGGAGGRRRARRRQRTLRRRPQPPHARPLRAHARSGRRADRARAVVTEHEARRPRRWTPRRSARRPRRRLGRADAEASRGRPRGPAHGGGRATEGRDLHRPALLVHRLALGPGGPGLKISADNLDSHNCHC